MTEAPPRLSRPGSEVRDADGLTRRDRLAVLHYIGAANRNQTEAVRLAGYAGTTDAGARAYASRVFSRPAVQALLAKLDGERSQRLSYTADNVLRDLIVLKTEAEVLPKNTQTIGERRKIIKDLGEHVAVGAFRRQLGLSGANGGPIETADLAALAALTDEELETLERARAILDRTSSAPADTERGDTAGGEGAPAEGD